MLQEQKTNNDRLQQNDFSADDKQDNASLKKVSSQEY